MQVELKEYLQNDYKYLIFNHIFCGKKSDDLH